MSKPTVTRAGFYNVANPPLRETLEGLTIRKVLKVLRNVTWGDLGTATVEFSDGDILRVELTPAHEKNCWLMNSQRGIRTRYYTDGAKEITGRYKI